MKCSVAIASYNGEKYIQEQMKSLLLQTVQADEVIISDDASTDNTVKIVEDFIAVNNLKNWYILQNDKNKGYAKNFYNALKHSKGEYVFLCDQDDVWCSQKIEHMLKVMQANPEIWGLNSLYDIIDATGNTIEPEIGFVDRNFDGTIEKINQEQFLSDSKFRGFAGCFSRQLLIDAGIFEDTFDVVTAHDRFLNSMASISGGNFLLRECLTHYRFSGENVSMQYLNKERKTKKEKAELVNIHLQSLYYYKTYMKKKGLEEQVTSKKFRIDRFIKFCEARLKLYKTKNIFLWFYLLSFYPQYWIIKQGYKKNDNLFLQAMRIYGGDLIYAFLR